MVHSKIILLFIGILCCAFQGQSQVSKVDSLFAIWSDTTNSAEMRVEAFYKRFNPMNPADLSNPKTQRWAPGLKEVLQLGLDKFKT